MALILVEVRKRNGWTRRTIPGGIANATPCEGRERPVSGTGGEATAMLAQSQWMICSCSKRRGTG